MGFHRRKGPTRAPPGEPHTERSCSRRRRLAFVSLTLRIGICRKGELACSLHLGAEMRWVGARAP